MTPTHIFRYVPTKPGTINMTQYAGIVILSDFDFSKFYRRIKPFAKTRVNLS